MSAGTSLWRPAARRGGRPGRGLQLGEIHVIRYVPGTSPVHRMWAGTKIVSLGALSIGLILWPNWRSVGIGAALILGAILLARLPAGVRPRLPWWLGAMVVLGAVLALLSGGSPTVHVGGLRLALGGLDNFGVFMVLAVDVLAAAALLSWTTPLADLSPALGRLLGPLRRVGLPVDEFIGAVALSIRCLPLLLEEARVMRAARRSRRPGEPRSFKELSEEAVETVFGALGNAIRRARELAEAIEARGGVPTAAVERHRLARVDLLGFAASALAVGAMAALR